MQSPLHALQNEVGAVADNYAVLLFGKPCDYPLLGFVEPPVVLEAGFGEGVAFLEEGFGAVGVELFVMLSDVIFCKVALFGYQADQLLVKYVDAKGVA